MGGRLYSGGGSAASRSSNILLVKQHTFFDDDSGGAGLAPPTSPGSAPSANFLGLATGSPTSHLVASGCHVPSRYASKPVPRPEMIEPITGMLLAAGVAGFGAEHLFSRAQSGLSNEL